MVDLNLEAATSKDSIQDVRSELEAALKKEFPGGMMRWTWQGDTLELAGPGAQGTVVLEDGRLVGSASLKPPASLMQGTIRDKMSRVLEKAAG